MYLFFLNSFHPIARDRSETAADGGECRVIKPANGVFFATIPKVEMFSYPQPLTLAYAMGADFGCRLFG
jgi:hypothetical protein